MALIDPAEEPAAEDFKDLVSARESFYASMSDRWVDIPEPRTNRAYALYAREIVHVPLGATAGSMIMFTTMETLGAWAVLPAAAAGLSIVFTGSWAKFRMLSPSIQNSFSADVAHAQDDFRAALSRLGRPDTPVDVIMAVRWFEPRMADAMRTLFDPEADPESAISARSAVLAIGARAWALTRLEEQRAQVIESVVATSVESDPAALEADFSQLDFTEIDAVAANISRATEAVAMVRDVEAGEFGTAAPEGQTVT